MAGPKPFNDTLVQLRFGELHDELTAAMNEMVLKVDATPEVRQDRPDAGIQGR